MPPKKSNRFIAHTIDTKSSSDASGAAVLTSYAGAREAAGGAVSVRSPVAAAGGSRGKSKNSLNNSGKTAAVKQSSGVANMVFGLDTPCCWEGVSYRNLAVYYIGCCLTLGLLYVACILNSSLYDWIVMREVSPEAATVCSIQVDGVRASGVVHIHPFGAYGSKVAITEIKCQRYMAHSSKGWKLFAIDDVPKDFPDMVLATGGASEGKTIDRSSTDILYGPNKMTLPEVDFLAILVRQILHPFYLFQYFAVIVWVSQDYVMYSLVILFITGSAIYMTATELVYNLKQLHNLAGSDRTVPVIDLATGVITQSPDALLLPGDCVVIQTGLVLPCDILLTSGRVTVDESMLTGESVPVTKNPVDMTMVREQLAAAGSAPATAAAAIDFSKGPGNIMFGGTHVVQASGGSADIAEGAPVGVVYKTGFRSAKGQLVATLLNPKEEFMGFFSDAINVVIFMFFLATFMFIWTGYNLRSQNAAWGLVFMKYLDAVTIAVPPALTASLTVATTISIARLRKKGIFVSETSRVNWAGICGAACFDKTGTLTEDRLVFERAYMPLRLALLLDGDARHEPAAEEDVWGSVHGKGTDESARDQQKANAKHMANMSVARGPHAEDLPRVCLELMATCHSLAVVDGAALGDPLEVELLRASGWTLSHDMDSPDLVALSGPPSAVTRHFILRHFEFTADKMRAGTLMKRPTGELLYLLKGSPEVILQLCERSSIPTDVIGLLDKSAKDGLRVIAMAYAAFGKDVDERALLRMSQEELETNIEFLGLLSMSNALKEETKATIATLIDADIHSNMITGDHVQTAIAIAYNCGLLNHTRPLFLLDTDDSNYISVQNISDLAASNCACLSDPRAIPSTISGIIALVKREVDEYSRGIPQLAISGRGMVLLRIRHPEYVADVVRSTQVYK
jgi:predicted P-type ATPase